MKTVKLQDIEKRFGTTLAVDRVDLCVPAGSLFFLLGPSGCGKTTLLRMVAGLVAPTRGAIFFDERNVTPLPANRRHCGMVFQNYALWPHMTVWQNVSFGLDVRKVPAGEKSRRVTEVLQRVQMLDYARRKPGELSGGQQQRVALARALVIEPTVLLLDEPLSNLDAQLRVQLRHQIKQICTDARITALYVTHDQAEALSMADQIAVMDRGRIRQVGTPRVLYERPADRFVAGFLGETNFVAAELLGRHERQAILQCAAGKFRCQDVPADLPETGNVTCSIRPEALQLVHEVPERPDRSLNWFDARLSGMVYMGQMAQHAVIVGTDLQLKVHQLNPQPVDARNRRVKVSFHPRDVAILQD